MKQSKGLRLHLNRELSIKQIQKNSVPSTAQESQLRSAQKQRHPVSTKSWATGRL
jgi:hypothetical protein